MPRIESPAAVQHLECERANAVRLCLRYMGYHWNVSGPFFHDLHLLFDEHAKDVLGTVDPLAERQRMLGATARYSMEELGTRSSLPDDSSLPQSPRAMIERLGDAPRQIIRGPHLGSESSEAEKDPGSADLFARSVQIQEKMEWFLRKLLQGRSLFLENAPARRRTPLERSRRNAPPPQGPCLEQIDQAGARGSADRVRSEAKRLRGTLATREAISRRKISARPLGASRS